MPAAIPITIRPASDADLPVIARLYAELHAAEWGDDPPFTISPEAWEAEVRTALSAPDTEVLVAAAGDEVVGSVRLELGVRPFGRVAEIRRLVVTGSWRRRGVATRLMAAADELAIGHGVVDLRLTVLTGNTDARSLYERLGYEEFAVRYRRPLT